MAAGCSSCLARVADMALFCMQVCDRGNLRLNEDGVPIEEVTMHLRHPNLVQTLDSAVAMRDLKPQRAGSIQSVRSISF